LPERLFWLSGETARGLLCIEGGVDRSEKGCRNGRKGKNGIMKSKSLSRIAFCSRLRMHQCSKLFLEFKINLLTINQAMLNKVVVVWHTGLKMKSKRNSWTCFLLYPLMKA
jgi:hypothetical protein